MWLPPHGQRWQLRLQPSHPTPVSSREEGAGWACPLPLRQGFSVLVLSAFGSDGSLLKRLVLYCRVFRTILGLYPLDAMVTSSFPDLQIKIFPGIAKYSWGVGGKISPDRELLLLGDFLKLPLIPLLTCHWSKVSHTSSGSIASHYADGQWL